LGWLGRARPEDEKAIQDSIKRALKVLPDLLSGQCERAQQDLHSQ